MAKEKGWKQHVWGRIIRRIEYGSRGDAEKAAKKLRAEGYETRIIAETYWQYPGGWDSDARARRRTDYTVLKRKPSRR